VRRSSDGKVRRSAAEWRTILRQFDESGLTRAEFCRRQGLDLTTFQRWRRRLENAQESFVEVAASAEPVAPWAMEIELASGAILRLRG